MKKLLVVLLGLAGLNVCVANPTYDVTRGALQNDPGSCQYGYNPNCALSRQYQRNQPMEIIHIKVPSKYKAWANNLKTGTSGGVFEMDSLVAAKRQAIKTCERDGQNKPCKVEAWVRNGCIAVAQGKNGKKWRNFFGTTDPRLAGAEALKKCQESGLPQCRITTTEGCSLLKF